jgi:predicted porin
LLSFGVTFAQVTLYGNVDQAWNSSTQKQGGKTTKEKSGFAGVQMGGSSLGVKGSEELTEGLKASFLIEMSPAVDDNSTGAAGMWNRQSYVSLDGGFGALRIGKQYSRAFNNVVGVDPGGATGIAGNASYCVLLAYSKCIEGSDAPLRQNNSVQYDLPELAAGLKAGVTLVYGEADTANGGKASGDGYGINLSYASGPLYAGITYDEVKNTGIGLLRAPGQTVSYTDTTTVDPVKGILQDVKVYEIKSYDISVPGKNELTTMSASYNLGMAKISINNSKMKVGSKSIDNTFGTVSVPFGGNANVWASISEGKAAGTKHDGYQLGLNFALSKRTIIYAQTGQLELKASTKVQVSGSALGIHHSF